jgi:hypothetical protein
MCKSPLAALALFCLFNFPMQAFADACGGEKGAISTCEERGGAIEMIGYDLWCRFDRALIGAWTLCQYTEAQWPVEAVEAYFSVHQAGEWGSPSDTCRRFGGAFRKVPYGTRSGSLEVCDFFFGPIGAETLAQGANASVNEKLTQALH